MNYDRQIEKFRSIEHKEVVDREKYLDKLRLYMKDTQEFANRHSRDRGTKCGSMVLSSDFGMRSMGYNGFPRKVDETKEERHERPEKYFWAEHSERNAIYNAARAGIALDGSLILIAAPIPPCMDCARGIIQSGIRTVVVQQDLETEHPTWKPHGTRAKQIFAEAGVEVIILNDRKETTI